MSVWILSVVKTRTFSFTGVNGEDFTSNMHISSALCCMKKEWLSRWKFNYIMLKESGNVTWYFLYKIYFLMLCIILYLFVLVIFFPFRQIHRGEVISTGVRIKKGSNTIYLLTAIGLARGDISTVHIYTQTLHRTTQWNRIPRTEHT